MTWNLIGHTWASDLLARHIANDSLRHAYLITGPAGVGRRTLALRLAQALSCTTPPVPGQPCLRCSTCQRIERMQHPDLSVTQSMLEIEVPKSEHPSGVRKEPLIGGVLKIEQILEMQPSLALAPYEAPYRVALVLRFQEANEKASNAFLKTLEEPNPRVILILTADSAETLYPTIVSRCEILRLRPVGLDEVESGLRDRGIEPELARLCAHISGGLPGLALQLAGDEEARQQRSTWIDDIHRLAGVGRIERFDYAVYLGKLKSKEENQRNIEELKQKLAIWGSFWRDILLRTSGASAAITNLDWNVEIDSFASQVDTPTATQALASIDRTLTYLRANVNPRLALEVLLLDLPRLLVAA
jgi:DNA polymerase-3 subunit delta'